MPSPQQSNPTLHHPLLHTAFSGILHHSSSDDIPIHQYRGIKYASIPARFRQSKLHNAYPSLTDASQHGPICPQVRCSKSPEEALVGGTQENFPQQTLKHDEFECLNLNITCPGGSAPDSRLPVMLWVHGGGDRGSGSHWMYDGGNIVRKSIEIGKPVILVTFNFRIGLLGFAASPVIRDDNKIAGEDGTGNYGLRDQRMAMEWLHHYISAFGGDPENITLFGAGSGGADIVCHMLSAANASHPLFSRAIVQSAIFEPTLPDIASAGWHLSRVMSALQISTIDQFRAIEADKLVGLGHTIRAVDDGVFFRKGWQAFFGREDAHMRHHRREHEVTHRVEHGLLAPPVMGHGKSRSRSRSSKRPLRSTSRTPTSSRSLEGQLQPLLIGDCSCDSLLWSVPISIWTSSGVVRRLKAICQSLSKANGVLRAYDISAYTSDDEIVDRVLELVNDARVAWPTECIVENAKREREGRGVWRYVFDQEGPARGIPHHAVDLVYLFDNVPLPASVLAAPEPDMYFDGPFDVSDSDSEDSTPSVKSESVSDEEWSRVTVDEWSYTRVRDAMQERWLTFAHGEAPWHEDKVFVFGPEGETGERSQSIFEGRRRRQMWKQALEPLGTTLVQKVGVELSRGPSYHC